MVGKSDVPSAYSTAKRKALNVTKFPKNRGSEASAGFRVKSFLYTSGQPTRLFASFCNFFFQKKKKLINESCIIKADKEKGKNRMAFFRFFHTL